MTDYQDMMAPELPEESAFERIERRLDRIEAILTSFDERVKHAEAALPAAAQDLQSKMNGTALGRGVLKALGL